jgi:hypothetical protein
MELALNLKVIYGAQSLRGKILSLKHLGRAFVVKEPEAIFLGWIRARPEVN